MTTCGGLHHECFGAYHSIWGGATGAVPARPRECPMSLARSVVAGLVVGASAGFLYALLRPRDVGCTQPAASRRYQYADPHRGGLSAGPGARAVHRPVGSQRHTSLEAIR